MNVTTGGIGAASEAGDCAAARNDRETIVHTSSKDRHIALVMIADQSLCVKQDWSQRGWSSATEVAAAPIGTRLGN